LSYRGANVPKKANLNKKSWRTRPFDKRIQKKESDAFGRGCPTESWLRRKPANFRVEKPPVQKRWNDMADGSEMAGDGDCPVSKLSSILDLTGALGKLAKVKAKGSSERVRPL